VASVQLHGLSTNEVLRLLATASQQTIPQPFAELVQRQTEGNPLFVRETLRYVIDTRLVERRDGALWRVGEQESGRSHTRRPARPMAFGRGADMRMVRDELETHARRDLNELLPASIAAALPAGRRVRLFQLLQPI
jgi:hypothetical protein